MKHFVIAGAAFLAMIVGAGAASARDQVGENDPIAVDAQKSYIFFRTAERRELYFLRLLTDADMNAFTARRAEALARAQARQARQARDWDTLHRTCATVATPSPMCTRQGPRPAEVTDEGFPFEDPEQGNLVRVTTGPQFTRADHDYTYLIAVPPGTYILYGQLVVTAQGGSSGYCMCMGSVRFEVQAGQIVDLGQIQYPALEAQRAHSPPASGRVPHMNIAPWVASMAMPVRLNNLPVVPARYEATGKMPNWFGVQVQRLPAMEGVLGYERDRVMDLRTNADAPASVRS